MPGTRQRKTCDAGGATTSHKGCTLAHSEIDMFTTLLALLLSPETLRVLVCGKKNNSESLRPQTTSAQGSGVAQDCVTTGVFHDSESGAGPRARKGAGDLQRSRMRSRFSKLWACRTRMTSLSRQKIPQAELPHMPHVSPPSPRPVWSMLRCTRST
jgi:hypothetical protein